MFSNLPANIANARKAIINIIGLVLLISTYVTVSGVWATRVAVAVAILTAISHYLTSNAPAPGTVPAQEDISDENVEEPQTEWLPSDLVTAGQVASNQQIEAPPNS